MNVQSSEVTRRGAVNDPNRADRRRKVLRSFMQEHELSPAQWSRDAKFTTPNAIYNFLNGRTSQLSQETYEKLAAVVPGATVEKLTGAYKAPASKGVVVRAEARAGEFRGSFDLPLSEQREMPVPIDAKERAAGAFAVVLRAPGMDLVWPDGTVLVCLPVARAKELETGRRVALQRQREDGVEITVRDLVVRDGRAHLWLRSAVPEFTAPIEMPWPYAGQSWKQGEDIFTLIGVVTMACVPEG